MLNRRVKSKDKLLKEIASWLEKLWEYPFFTITITRFEGNKFVIIPAPKVRLEETKQN